MNKRILLIFVSLLTILITYFYTIEKVNAFTYQGSNILTICGDGKYSVDRIIGYDQFQNVGCYSENEFNLAYQKMLEVAPNSVIRHNSSQSPMNIVAADRAMVYTQSETYLKTDTVNMFSDKNLDLDSKSPSNYLWSRMSAYYYGTEIKGSPSNVTPSDLVAQIELNGAKGYVQLSALDIIPLIYVENRSDMKTDGTPSWIITFFTLGYDQYGNEKFVERRITPHVTYYYSYLNPTINQKELIVRVDTATSFFKNEIGFAPEWMTSTSDILKPIVKYYSSNGINFYHDMDLKNPIKINNENFEFYNYYNYLPLRSKTNYTSSELNSYLRSVFTNPDNSGSVIINNEQLFIEAQKTYGMNALIIFSLGLLESDYGRSTYSKEAANFNGKFLFDVITKEPLPYSDVKLYCTAVEKGTYLDENNIQRYCLGKNNIFGYGAYDSNPNNADAYKSLKDGIDKQMGRNLRYYLDAMNSNQYASNIGNKGVGINTRYASDPWWSVKIASFTYKIDKYLGFKDYNYYQIGLLKNNVNRDFYSDYSLGTKLYSINTKASTFTVVINERKGDIYKIQSSNPINPIENINTIIVSPSGSYMKPVNWKPTLQYKYSNVEEVYDWSTSYDYKSSSEILLINTAKNPINIISVTDQLLYGIDKFEWINENTIYIKGMGILDNTAMPIVNNTKHTIILKNTISGVEYAYSMNVVEGLFNNYNNLTYNSVRYDGNIDVSSLPDGSYYYILKTEYSDTSGISILSDPAYNPIMPKINVQSGRMYKTVMDNWNYMEYQLLIQSNLPALPITDILPTEYMTVVQIYDYALSEDNKLSINGLGYINGINMSSVDEKQVKLILISTSDSLNSYSFDLNSHNEGFDPSIDGFDYSYSWFRSSLVDLNTIPDGEYKIYVYIKSGAISDFAEIRDFSFKEDLTISNTSKTVQFKLNNSRREYRLIISSK